MIEAFLFDLDGTLLNTLDDITDSVNITLQEFHYQKLTKLEVRDRIGDGITELIKRIMPNADDQTLEKALVFYRAAYAQKQFDNTKPYDGILDILTTIKDANRKICVVTNKRESAAIELTKRYFDGLIDLTLGDNSMRKLKPNTELITDAISQLNVQIENTILIGDSEMDAIAAQNANIQFIGVKWGYRDENQLRVNPKATLIDTPPQLKSHIKTLLDSNK